ncbi:hypothetical protein ACLB1S_29905 [Escherichia coli]
MHVAVLNGWLVALYGPK